MFTKLGLQTLHGWTHECLDLLLEHSATLPPGRFCAPLEAFGGSSVRDQLVHILSAERGWVIRLRLQPATPLKPADYPAVAEVRQAKRHIAAATLAYLDGLTEDELNSEPKQAPVQWIGPRRSPAFIVHHILTHAFHHKGQIVAMFRVLGHPAPDTDLQRA